MNQPNCCGERLTYAGKDKWGDNVYYCAKCGKFQDKDNHSKEARGSWIKKFEGNKQ
jgi:hypothetical protein